MSRHKNTKIKHLDTKYAIAFRDLICNCDGEELRFYLYLKLYAINKSSAWPSRDTILKDLKGMTVWKLRNLVKKMKETGNLIYYAGKGRRSSEYDITKYDVINGQKVDNLRIGCGIPHPRGDENHTSEVMKTTPERLYIELLLIEQGKLKKKDVGNVDKLIKELIEWNSRLTGFKKYDYKAWVRVIKKYGLQNTWDAVQLSSGDGVNQYKDFWERLKASKEVNFKKLP